MRIDHHLKITKSERRRNIHSLMIAGVFIALLFIGVATILNPDASITSAADTSWYDGGTGIYEISTADEFAGLASIVNSGNDLTDSVINLTADINLSSYSAGVGWTPIGFVDGSGTKYYFNGTFDGNNNSIQNLTVRSPTSSFSSDCGALFGNIGTNGTVTNLTIDGGSVISRDYVGSVAGQNYGTVSNCCNTCLVTGSYEVGGLVGDNYGTIEDCYNTADIGDTDADDVGGLVGDNYGTVSHCYNTGSVTGKSDAGGLVGWNLTGTFSYCYNAGTVNCNDVLSVDIGGVASVNDWILSNCYNTGTINGGTCDYIGGVTGLNNYGGSTIEDCYNTGSVSGNTRTGMVCIGGVIGYNYGTLSNSYNIGMVSGVDAAAYIMSSGEYVGGVVGENYSSDMYSGIVLNCYNTGNVISSGPANYVGGVVGWNRNASLQYCYNYGLISGNCYVGGGVVGHNDTSKVQNCYNTGTIGCNCTDIGGVVGQNDNAFGGGSSTIGNCYNAGAITGSGTYMGGVVGISSGGVISNTYYDSIVCSCALGIGSGSGNATPLTTEQMVASDVLESSGYMNLLGGAFEKRNAAADDYYCYYPELSVFKESSDNIIEETSKLSVSVKRLIPDLSATTTAIDKGQTLNDSNLDVTATYDNMTLGTIPVSGTAAWIDGTIKPSISDSGVTPYGYLFTPSSEIYMPVSSTVTVIVNAVAIQGGKEYYITATADSNSSITPNGVVTVQSENNITFVFSASSGYLISSVTVDSKPLPQDKISQGYYTFSNVISNHSIDIASSVDQGTSADPDDSNNGGDSGNGSGSSDGHGSSLLWWALGLIILLILIGLLIWFLLFYRRYYDVIKVESAATIIGKDKAHRKSEYRFSIDGVFSGKVSYRVGEEGLWNALLPSTSGEYTIPKGEITDDVTIEVR